MDPQGHSTLGLNCLPESIKIDPVEIYLSTKGEGTPIEQAVIPQRENLHLIPSTIELASFEPRLTGLTGREYRLKEHLRTLTIHYDYIIIDCPPSLGLLTFNALMAAREVMIPIDTSLYSLHGVTRLLEIIELIEKHSGHKLNAKALAVNVDRRTKFALEIVEDIRNHFADNMYRTIIHRNVRLREAASYGKPIDDYDRHSLGMKDYDALAQELIDNEKFVEILTDIPEEDFLATTTEHPIGDFFVFEYQNPDAGKVAIVGDFNNWNPEMGQMKQDSKNGYWKRQVYLTPGPHEYKFVVDGDWVLDPSNDTIAQTNMGTENSLLLIEEKVK
jgi:chromosome partitioning protein